MYGGATMELIMIDSLHLYIHKCCEVSGIIYLSKTRKEVRMVSVINLECLDVRNYSGLKSGSSLL